MSTASRRRLRFNGPEGCSSPSFKLPGPSFQPLAPCPFRMLADVEATKPFEQANGSRSESSAAGAVQWQTP